MTNKFMYFIANWKMFGDLKSLNSLTKVINFSKKQKKKRFKLIYCPPFTLLNLFFNRLKKTNIDIGAQNCHHDFNNTAHTGCINSKMVKNIGAKYIILGHSENRLVGDNDLIINMKIKSSIKNNLKIIFCIGETNFQKRKKLTYKILSKQIKKGLNGVKNFNSILFAYEPVWAIGTGVIPSNEELKKNINYIKNTLKKNFNLKKPKVLYGGSVNPINVKNLRKINIIDGFLVGGASQNPNKFIDIVKKNL